ncbi:hypothetical protein CXB51_029640 [Gossypium anomalum]|uniref:R13L1/DRL21-like LRR repeat region domain-containing protein n=1 Tax=Gossypium anomalum TaxID=47600 RepID=A0A8J6CQP0_9ROSI|nr:hypothetical protein CXB51_029640 [Gossypium anomalum]
MGNLVNLHYLDIRGAYLIERIPFRIDKLTNLQRLSNFIIGEGEGHSIRELKYLSNLKGDFCLSGLENVNGEDAREAKLNEKQGIDRLVLEWSRDFKKDTRKKEVEEWILPSRICCHWSFTTVKIANLYHRLEESLCFRNMLNWEEWDLCEDDEQVSKFPSLHFLSIRECPLLLGRLPTILQSLQTLKIYECKRLVVSISSFPLLCELWVKGCEELLDEGSLSAQKVTSLKYVSLSNISKFNISAERIMLRFANFETFKISGWKELGSLSQNGLSIVGHHFITIWDCPQLVSLETEEEILQLNKIPGVESLRVNFPPALKELGIVNCVNLQYLVDEKENNNKSMSSNTCLLERLYITSCPSLIWLSSRGDICNRLQHLQIERCSKLSSLFLNAKLPVMLKQLLIRYCPMYECIAQNFLETTDLESIRIWGAENIKSLPRGLDKLSHLQEIQLILCPNLVSFAESGLPTTNLRVLTIEECENCWEKRTTETKQSTTGVLSLPITPVKKLWQA